MSDRPNATPWLTRRQDSWVEYRRHRTTFRHWFCDAGLRAFWDDVPKENDPGRIRAVMMTRPTRYGVAFRWRDGFPYFAEPSETTGRYPLTPRSTYAAWEAILNHYPDGGWIELEIEDGN